MHRAAGFLLAELESEPLPLAPVQLVGRLFLPIDWRSFVSVHLMRTA